MSAKPKILIVDDEEMIRELLRMALEEIDCEIAEAENGRRGVEQVKRSPPDLMITDIIMPEMEGIETIVEVRKLSPKTRIIAISGGGRTSNMDFLQFAKRLGADEVIAKPFGPDEIVAAVERVLAGPKAT